MQLSWTDTNSNPNEEETVIYRTDNHDGAYMAPIAAVGPNVTSYVDLYPATHYGYGAYYYKVLTRRRTAFDSKMSAMATANLGNARISVQRWWWKPYHFYNVGTWGPGGYVEIWNYFRIVNTPDFHFGAPPLQGLYLCHWDWQKYFLSLDAGCETAYSNGQIGWVVTTPVEGTTRLYRLYNASNGDHFYTTNPSEAFTDAVFFGYTWDSWWTAYVWTDL